MTFEEFKESLKSAEPPAGTPELLCAMWHEARGDWDRAHRVAQDIGTTDGSRVHAYLHRKEGDADNARYWYSRAGRQECRDPLEREWEQLTRELLEQP
jgi:hypothetical protein